EQRLDLRYIRAVEHAGGLPVVVPMLADEELTREVSSSLDGLVVTGGPAVVDGLIGSLPDDINETDPVRTRSDKAILHHFFETGRPVLGICYGMQLGNALLGGQIYADVQNQLDGAHVHSEKRGGTSHPINIASGTILHSLLGQEEITTNTRHIQAIARVGDGLKISATAPDGVIEAIESTDGAFIGIQFHPERTPSIGQPLFAYLVRRASNN
ncbi:MAG: gamma-glutamyl-gamma-aminobutyrate hydrolase family protein, partial [Rubricoccaceae bacterium]|nr:gamma-glutamyl-gamma-aminobutyrate hydrolase family protein [Rubricoccaceae bacterium]